MQVRGFPRFASKLASAKSRIFPARALFEIDGLLYTDQFTAIRMHYDEDTPKTFDVTIGTGSDMEDPIAQAVRTIQTMWSAVGTLFGSNDLF